MRIEILQEAQDELSESVSYYEEIEPGLEVRLKEEIRTVIQWIAQNPEIPRLRPGGYRRVNLKVFRYYVPYLIWNETIWIIAIAHGSRHPEYWMKRKTRRLRGEG